MRNFWDERYAGEWYAYGTEPNLFFSEQLNNLNPGKILIPGDGEGRNGVYAARLGWEVTSFDISVEGKRKAKELARKYHVEINFEIQDYENVFYPYEKFDLVALIYTHMHPLKREEYHRKFMNFLKPGGTLILEGFSKKQIHRNSGGPRDANMLFSIKELESDFAMMSSLQVYEQEIDFSEGQFHQGIADVIRVTGKK